MAVQTLESVVDCNKFVTVAPVATTMSSAANPTGTSEKVKVSTAAPDFKLVGVEVIVTVGAAVSSVKVSAAEAALTLPATSVWRRYTVLLPTAAVGAVALQPEVPLLLYSNVAPVSPVGVSAPLLVILSEVLEPLSVVKATVGAVGAKVSPVIATELLATLLLLVEFVNAPAATLMAPVRELTPLVGV